MLKNEIVYFFERPFQTAVSGFLKHWCFCTKYFKFSLFCPNSLAPECYIAQLVQCNVVFLVENGVHQFLHLVLRSFSNYQIFLCIKYHVSSNLFTLWNAYTSYELSSFLSRTQICEHFKDPTINSLKRKPSLFVKLLGYAIFGKFLLGKETFEV